MTHELDLVCILETRVRFSNKDRIFNSILPGWSFFHNYDQALLGRIWICGNPEKVSIDIVHSMDQAMLCHVTALQGNYSFWCLAIYADGGMAKEWSADPLEIPLGPITRARAKRFKEALNVLIQDSQAEGAHGLNSKKETKLVHVIKVNPNLDQELRRF